MIELIPITDSEELNPEFRQIYEEAFPLNERREWRQQAELLANTHFSFVGAYHQHKIIGFYSIWKLDDYHFIEHFAIRETERGKGFGTQVFQQILTRISNPVILEVEEPFTPEARRRISFYESLNFFVSEGDYYQPPYSTGKNKVKMLLMSYPERIPPDDFEAVQSGIHEVVYRNN